MKIHAMPLYSIPKHNAVLAGKYPPSMRLSTILRLDEICVEIEFL